MLTATGTFCVLVLPSPLSLILILLLLLLLVSYGVLVPHIWECETFASTLDSMGLPVTLSAN